MSETENLVVAHFRFVDDTETAIRTLREKGIDDYQLFTPFPHHGLEEEVYKGRKRSPVRRFTLIGGLSGCLLAFLMTCWMSIDWPLRTSAKTIISIPAFVVVAFECTILLGGLVTLIGMLLNSRIPTLASFPGFRPEFTSGTLGIAARVMKDNADELKRTLEKCGAVKVEVQYVR